MKTAGENRLKNPKHELFCWLYSGYNNDELFGNATQCYILVMHDEELRDIENEITELDEGYSEERTKKLSALRANKKRIENNARSLAARLVANVSVTNRINFLMDQLISEETMDRELAFAAMQRNDLSSKVQALREFNRLRDRGAAGRLEGSFTFSWEGDDAEKPKKVTLKKATIKKDAVEWEQ